MLYSVLEGMGCPMRGTGLLHSVLKGIVSDFMQDSLIIFWRLRSADMSSEVALPFVASSAGLTLMPSPLI